MSRTIGAYNNNVLAANDEFDTTGDDGFFTGDSAEEGKNDSDLFGDGEEQRARSSSVEKTRTTGSKVFFYATRLSSSSKA